MIRMKFVLQFDAMNTFSIKEIQTFVSFDEQGQSAAEFALILSPSGSLLALYNSNQILVLNTTSKNMVARLSSNAQSVLFSIDDVQVFISDSFSLQRVNIQSKKSSIIIQSNKQHNKIGNLAYSPDHKLIYFTNQSHLSSYSPSSASYHSNSLNSSAICPIDTFFIDPVSQTLVSSSYDCKICSFSTNYSGITFLSSNSIAQCRIGGIIFANNYAYLTQDSIISKQPQIIMLSIPQLSVVSYLNQSSTNFSLQLSNFRNHLISFGRGDDYLWIYQSTLTNKPNKVELSYNIFGMVFNTQFNQAYLLLLNESSFLIQMKSFVLTFNCSLIKDTLNGSLQFEEKCLCKSGMLFDSSSNTCKAKDCRNTQDSPCKCPYQSTFDSFSLDCSLDCSSIYNTYSSISFGNPSRCSCNYPFQWNPLLGDCSYIDCRLIQNTVQTNLSQRCLCQPNYIWEDSTVKCNPNNSSSIISWDSSNSSPVGLIIAIIFIILIVIISAVIFYVKKYRKSSEDLPKTYEYPRKYEQHNPTPRPFSLENFRTSQELKDPSSHSQDLS